MGTVSEKTLVRHLGEGASVRARLAAFVVGAMLLALLPSLTGRGVANAAKADPALLRAAAAAPSSLLHLIVREASPGSTAAERVVRDLGGAVTHELPIIGGFSATLPAHELGRMLGTASVSSVYGDPSVKMAGTSAKALNSLAPNTVWQNVIGLPNVSADGSGVGVALLDTGVADVADLHGRVVNGLDLTTDHDGVDHFGHGTHMAGIIAGNGASSKGLWQGVAPGATIISVKVANWNGSTDVSEVIYGLQWVYFNASQYNIRVLNLSFGTDATQSYSIDPLDYAVEKVWKSGVLVVVAAGNRGANGASTINDPGNDPYVLTVGAANLNNTLTALDDAVAPFSSRGPTVDGFNKPDLVAPGVTIVSDRAPGSTIDQAYPSARVGTAYFKGTGTSQSAAIVSGVAALMYQVNPSLTPDQAKAVLMGTALATFPGPGDGAGLVRAARAVNWAQCCVARVPPVNQGLTPSTGTGSIEASRGSFHVYADLNGDGTPDLVQGEIDALGNAWDDQNWAANMWDANTWDANMWDADAWDGTSWDATSWDATSWDATSWDADAWDANTWDSADWS
jgi:serine protease AprX